MKLTNEELLKMADSSISQDVKEFICKQKMSAQEVAMCRSMGNNPVDYMMQKTMDANVV